MEQSFTETIMTKNLIHEIDLADDPIEVVEELLAEEFEKEQKIKTYKAGKRGILKDTKKKQSRFIHKEEIDE